MSWRDKRPNWWHGHPRTCTCVACREGTDSKKRSKEKSLSKAHEEAARRLLLMVQEQHQETSKVETNPVPKPLPQPPKKPLPSEFKGLPEVRISKPSRRSRPTNTRPVSLSWQTAQELRRRRASKERTKRILVSTLVAGLIVLVGAVVGVLLILPLLPDAVADLVVDLQQRVKEISNP